MERRFGHYLFLHRPPRRPARIGSFVEPMAPRVQADDPTTGGRGQGRTVPRCCSLDSSSAVASNATGMVKHYCDLEIVCSVVSRRPTHDGSSLNALEITKPITATTANNPVQAPAIRQAVPKTKSALARPSIHCSNSTSAPTTTKARTAIIRPRHMNIRRTRRAGDSAFSAAGALGHAG